MKIYNLVRPTANGTFKTLAQNLEIGQVKLLAQGRGIIENDFIYNQQTQTIESILKFR